MLQSEIPRAKIEELVNAIHKTHEKCDLDHIGVEKNVERILQSYRHTLWGEIFGSFELIRHIMYIPAFQETRITTEMRDAFWNKDWSLITQRMIANSLYITLMGLRKIIEKENETDTSSITVITQKFKNLLSFHTKKDESIEPFLKNLEDTTEELKQLKKKTIDPLTDRFIAHMETNTFSKIEADMPTFESIQKCIDLCERYYQIIYSFYLDTHYGLHNLKQQIAWALYPFLDALRVSEEYNRDEIIAIIFNEKSISKRNEEIAKRLMKIIEPRLYEGMLFVEASDK